MTRPHLGADAAVFLGRLTHLDPAAVVRLRPVGTGRVALWAHLPWRVLVTRQVTGAVSGDVTLAGAELLAMLTAPAQAAPAETGPAAPAQATAPAETGPAAPAPRDHLWRWPLPGGPSRVVEEIPPERLRQVAAAAAGTLREVTATGLGGRAVGVRVVREALLDHVAVVVHPDLPGPGGDRPVEIPQRLVQAVVRMGFLGTAPTGPTSAVRVVLMDRWIALAAQHGTAWLPIGTPLLISPVKSV